MPSAVLGRQYPPLTCVADGVGALPESWQPFETCPEGRAKFCSVPTTKV